jgi:hypothetical protein
MKKDWGLVMAGVTALLFAEPAWASSPGEIVYQSCIREGTPEAECVQRAAPFKATEQQQAEEKRREMEKKREQARQQAREAEEKERDERVRQREAEAQARAQARAAAERAAQQAAAAKRVAEEAAAMQLLQLLQEERWRQLEFQQRERMINEMSRPPVVIEQPPAPQQPRTTDCYPSLSGFRCRSY